MRLEAANALGHQGCDVSVATVLAQGSRMEETGHHVIRGRDRQSAAYIGRTSNGALVAAVSNRSAARANAGAST